MADRFVLPSLLAIALPAAAIASPVLVQFPHTGEVIPAPVTPWIPKDSVFIKAAGGPTFTITYDDVVLDTNVGFDDPATGAARRSVMEAVLTYLSTVFNHTGRCDISVVRSQTDGTGFLARGGPYFLNGSGLTNGFPFQHITTGTDPNTTVPDLQMEVDFGWRWNSSLEQPAFSETDLFSVLLHEVTHGLGITTNARPTGELQVAGTLYFWEDFFHQPSPLLKLFGPAPDFDFQGTSLTTGDNTIQFRGPAAFAALGSYPFIQSGSTAHWQSLGTNTAAVMRQTIVAGTTRRQYLAFELGALKDLGYSINMPTPTPSPSPSPTPTATPTATPVVKAGVAAKIVRLGGAVVSADDRNGDTIVDGGDVQASAAR